jgi:hypothetical protein
MYVKNNQQEPKGLVFNLRGDLAVLVLDYLLVVICPTASLLASL